jgi:hypothetical protein
MRFESSTRDADCERELGLFAARLDALVAENALAIVTYVELVVLRAHGLVYLLHLAKPFGCAA